MGQILVTGAGGYIGGRLAERFIDADVDIRVAGRDPRRSTDRWPGVDSVELDVMRPETIGPATEGITTAYYLIHSMEEGGAPFEERDRTAATNFARAAAESGVQRVVFLGVSATTRIPTSLRTWPAATRPAGCSPSTARRSWSSEPAW